MNVVKVYEPQTLSGGKRKQEVIVADCTGKAMITLWETDIDRLELHKSYQLNRLEIRAYQGKYYLSFPSTASVDCISDIEDAIDPFSSEDDDEEHHGVTISGIKQLETVYICISCSKHVDLIDTQIGKCSTCGTIQKLCPKQTAKLLIQSGNQ